MELKHGKCAVCKSSDGTMRTSGKRYCGTCWERHTVMETARDSLNGYIANGPAYWPCSQYFTLASLDVNGETDGGGADVCRTCVRTVADAALAIMEGARVKFARVPRRGERYSAVVTCGPAPAYDLTGNGDTHADAYDGEPTWCAQCGAEIA